MTDAHLQQPAPALLARIVPVAYHAAAGSTEGLADVLSAPMGADAAAIREVILQTYLFAGYPRALNALRVFRDAAVAQGIDLDALDRALPAERTGAACREAGESLFALVYGAQREAVQRTARSLHPDLARWMIDEGYGRVLARQNLPPTVREPAIVASLVPLAVPLQLVSHVLGCRNAGCNAATMRCVRAEIAHAASATELAALDSAYARAGFAAGAA